MKTIETTTNTHSQQHDPANPSFASQPFFAPATPTPFFQTARNSQRSPLQTYPQAGEPLPANRRQALYYHHRNTVVNIEGKNEFAPGSGLAHYIASLWVNGQDAPVNIKFGSLASGYIWVKQTGKFYSEICLDLFFGVLEACTDLAPEVENYQAQPQVIPFQHPDLDTTGKNGTLVLIVRIDAGIISGELGWIAGKTADQIEPLMDYELANTAPEVFHPLIHGEEHARKPFALNASIPFRNRLTDGLLSLLLIAELEVDHQQTLQSTFSLVNGSSLWFGYLSTEIQGADDYDLLLQRTPQGYMSGESDGLILNKSWKQAGFSADADLNISYVNANLSVTGHATLTSRRASGSISIALTDQETAQKLFLKHVPMQQAETEVPETFLDTALPDPTKPLAITAWGQLHLIVIDNVKKLEADAAFVVSPEGYLITAGQVKLQKDYALMDRVEDQWVPIEIERSITVYPWGIPVTFSASGSLATGYGIGDIAFVELLASGVYSTHPNYSRELCLAGTVDMPADFWARIRVSAAAGIGIQGRSVVEIRGGAQGEAEFKVFVRATPTIKVQQTQGETPVYCIGGQFYAGGQLQLKIAGDLSINLFKLGKEDKTEKKLVGTRTPTLTWTIADFGAELGVEYILGSGDKPKFSYSGKKFDQGAFLKALIRSKSNAAKRDAAVKGGFQEEGQEKGTSQDQPFDPLHPVDAPVVPYAITDSFSMNGSLHSLFLIVKGNQNAVQTELEMQSPIRRRLNDKVDEELLRLRALLIHPFLDLTEAQEKKIEQAIDQLKVIQAEGEKVRQSAQQLAAEGNASEQGVEQLGDMISNYGNRFSREDLGGTTSNPPTSTGGVKAAPPGVEVILKLPWQKSTHLPKYQEFIAKGELFHSTSRMERDTDQVTKWNDNLKERVSIALVCRSIALELYLSGQDDPARNLLRPYWTPKRILGKNIKGDQMRMTVDHVIEYQLRPIQGGDWVDEPWNFELLEPSANSSSGSKLKDNIKAERERLAKLTGDESWLKDDIQFTKVEVDGTGQAERYSESDIETGKQLNDYKRLAGAVEDKQVLDDCKQQGSVRL